MSERDPDGDACLAIAAGVRLRVAVPADALDGTVTAVVTRGQPARDALARASTWDCAADAGLRLAFDYAGVTDGDPLEPVA